MKLNEWWDYLWTHKKVTFGVLAGLLMLIMIVASQCAEAHRGRTDEFGGHWNRALGLYECHDAMCGGDGVLYKSVYHMWAYMNAGVDVTPVSMPDSDPDHDGTTDGDHSQPEPVPDDDHSEPEPEPEPAPEPEPELNPLSVNHGQANVSSFGDDPQFEVCDSADYERATLCETQIVSGDALNVTFTPSMSGYVFYVGVDGPVLISDTDGNPVPSPEPTPEPEPEPEPSDGEVTDGTILYDQVDRVYQDGQWTQPYADVACGETVPSGTNWPWRGNAYDFMKLKCTADGKHYGGAIGANTWGGHSEIWMDTPTVFPNPDTGEMRTLYLRWKLKTSFWDKAGHKYFRILDTVGGKQQDVHFFWTPMHFSTNERDFLSDWKETRLVLNEWNTLEMWADLDKGVIKTWFNGEPVHNITDWQNDTNRGLQLRLLGWDGAGGQGEWPGEMLALDDIYISKTFDRWLFTSAAGPGG